MSLTARSVAVEWYIGSKVSEPHPLDQTAPSFQFTELERFGNYRLIGPLARGGMAELSLALQTGLEGFSRVVALKRVIPAMAISDAFVQMFLDEARLAARLDHPYIVRIYELGQEQDRFFMAMEYLPGEDLLQIGAFALAANVHTDPDIAATVIEKAAEALHFAHQLTDSAGKPLSLVHRDVTPSNIIVTYLGHVKVVDFGIARAANNSFETEPGMLKGKFGYLAPEMFTANAELDRRADIYCLGIVLWELLSGEKLFQRDTQAATLAAAHDHTIPPLANYRADVDRELEAICHKALAKNPAERFQTGAEMQDAIEQYMRSRKNRPSERDLARWLTFLGGDKRAELKLSIARGSNVMMSFAELRKLAPGSAPGVRSSESPLPAPPRPWWQVALFALLALGVVGGAAWFATRPAGTTTTVEQTRSSAVITSEPEGAFVFIDGEPTGRVTPTTLSGLDASKPLKVRVEKVGYKPSEDTVALEPGKQVSKAFQLSGN